MINFARNLRQKKVLGYMASKKEISKESIIKNMSSLWDGLGEEEMELLEQHLIIRKYKKNEVIYKYGDTPLEAMCLIQGKIKVYKDGIGGRNQIIRAIKSYEFFAYRAYFAGECYRTGAMAIEPCYVAAFPIGILVKLMEKNSHIGFFFFKQLCIEMGKSDDRTINLTQKHIRGRLAEALLFLMDSYGLEEDGYTLSIYLSREDLASLSNMTTSNAIRTLSAFANEKLIAIDGRKIKLIKKAELKKISDEG